jgi:prepilin peptidase CpaA
VFRVSQPGSALTVNTPLWTAIPMILVTAIAVREDLRTHRIPNWLVGTALSLGLLVHGILGGWPALLAALAGAVVAGLILLPGWLLKLMGAGDVKLMAAIGAWLGTPRLALFAALFSLIAGGVISLVVAIRRRAVRRTLRDAALLAPRIVSGLGGRADVPVGSGIRVPKALAILAGALLTLWWCP